MLGDATVAKVDVGRIVPTADECGQNYYIRLIITYGLVSRSNNNLI
jgi:hypothetical protein